MILQNCMKGSIYRLHLMALYHLLRVERFTNLDHSFGYSQYFQFAVIKAFSPPVSFHRDIFKTCFLL